MNDGYGHIKKYIRAANYLTAAQIFLGENVLLKDELTHDNIKPRLLGHWGSGPGVNFTYAHLNEVIKRKNLQMMFVLGPGHAFPALQANLFLEGSLGKYYPHATHTKAGIEYICKSFSWPYGFPSHSNPGTPGVILEGGELGYSLATSYGSVMDNPDLVTACLIGDGEAETGPTATAWHLNKLVNPKTNGVVLPILHLNGYKISGPTIFGRMSNEELLNLFRGYGYEPFIVEGENLHAEMAYALDRSADIIREVKSHDAKIAPRMPMIILKTLKGWSGVKELDGVKIEGNYAAHQVVLTEAKHDDHQLQLLNEWLRSYKFQDLFSENSGFDSDVMSVVPPNDQKMGGTAHATGGEPHFKPLKLPSVELFAEDASIPGTIGSSSMRRAGLYLDEVFKLNADNHNFRLMSPDETYSNKLDKIFDTTSRAWVWPKEEWDKDMDYNGRVMEFLSEHNLQGLAQGYILTGRHAIFASYEAFIQVVGSMMDQYAKFLKQAREVDWRGDISSLNYILTSSGWRQEHNGFSHQNPGFIDDVLQRQGDFVNVYFPPGGNSMLVVLEKTLQTRNNINVIVAGKTLEARWLTPTLAREQIEKGIMIWDFASDDNPDIVLAGVGEYLTKECLAALSLAKQEHPALKLRYIGISTMSARGFGSAGNQITKEYFNQTFTENKPVICNFHGYPQTMKQVLFDYSGNRDRFSIHGYSESGSTTTPYDMHVRNKTSRWHLLIEIFEKAAMDGVVSRERAEKVRLKYQNKLEQHLIYIKEHGVDMDEVENWQWNQQP